MMSKSEQMKNLAVVYLERIRNAKNFKEVEALLEEHQEKLQEIVKSHA